MVQDSKQTPVYIANAAIRPPSALTAGVVRMLRSRADVRILNAALWQPDFA